MFTIYRSYHNYLDDQSKIEEERKEKGEDEERLKKEQEALLNLNRQIKDLEYLKKGLE